MDEKSLLNKPIFFERNRVYRVYKGGGSYPSFFNTNEEGDNDFPEEWIASTVEAINPVKFGKRDGVSVIKDTSIFFDDLVKKYPSELLGTKNFDILIKFLDSAIRLPMQVHPTKEFSRKYLNSNYGKTESWYVVKTRPGAKLFFGFKDKIDIDKVLETEEKSETKRNIWESLVYSVDVKEGDCFIIEAGLVHALGYGCLVIEVQEPTDFTIQPERWCGDTHLTEKIETIGLKKEIAASCFNFDYCGPNIINRVKVNPVTEINNNGYIKENLITYNHTTCFKTNKHKLSNSSFILNGAPSVFIVTSGEGVIKGDNYEYKIKRGDYFFLPYIANDKYTIETNSNIELFECLPSMQE